jgi:hypothetical protein
MAGEPAAAGLTAQQDRCLLHCCVAAIVPAVLRAARLCAQTYSANLRTQAMHITEQLLTSYAPLLILVLATRRCAQGATRCRQRRTSSLPPAASAGACTTSTAAAGPGGRCAPWWCRSSCCFLRLGGGCCCWSRSACLTCLQVKLVEGGGVAAAL